MRIATFHKRFMLLLLLLADWLTGQLYRCNTTLAGWLAATPPHFPMYEQIIAHQLWTHITYIYEPYTHIERLSDRMYIVLTAWM